MKRNSMLTKIIAVLLCALMVAAWLPKTSAAANDFESGMDRIYGTDAANAMPLVIGTNADSGLANAYYAYTPAEDGTLTLTAEDGTTFTVDGVAYTDAVAVTAGTKYIIVATNAAKAYSFTAAFEDEAPTPLQLVKSISVDLGNTLAIKFIIDPDLDNDGTLELIGTDNVAVISKLIDGEWTVVAELPQSEWATYTQGRFVASYDRVAAKEMVDLFKIVVNNNAGDPVSIAYEDSVRAYAMRAINGMSANPSANKAYATQLPMFVDILNYGAAAQTNFSYKTNDLANSLMSDAQKDYATDTASGENNKVGIGGTQCSIEARIEMAFTYTKTNVDQTMSALVTYINHTGATFEETIAGADFETYNGKWRIPVNGLSLADGDRMATCKIYSADGVEIESLTTSDSVNGYWTRVVSNSNAPANLRALGDAALKVSASAYAYFHRNDK